MKSYVFKLNRKIEAVFSRNNSSLSLLASTILHSTNRNVIELAI